MRISRFLIEFLSSFCFGLVKISAPQNDAGGIVYPTDKSPCKTDQECIPLADCKEAIGRMSSTVRCGWNHRHPLVCCSVRERFQIPNDESCGHISLTTVIRNGKFISRVHRLSKRRAAGLGIGVVGGITSLRNSRPWMAALKYREPEEENFDLICGGALIGRKFILTAAHCFDGRSQDVNNYLVQLGDTKSSSDKSGFPVSAITIHEKYKLPTYYNDIAILVLKQEVHYTDDIRAICLPNPEMIAPLLNITILATAAGWGRLGFFNDFSKDLQEVDLPIVSNSRCNVIYTGLNLLGTHYPNGITTNILCAGYENDKKDTCQGDSGGPLFLNSPSSGLWTIVGIVSSGFRCAAGIPGLYTRVDAYSEWITRKINSF